MPAAEVPGSESPKAETGQSTKVVGGVGRNISNRIAITALFLASLGGLLVLGGCSTYKFPICAKASPTLTPDTGSTGSTLPPSHDNDAARGAGHDLHPDADVDGSQLPNRGRCQKS